MKKLCLPYRQSEFCHLQALLCFLTEYYLEKKP